MEIRDPIHGAIPVSAAELSVVDHPHVQRLRNIKQMGFSELSFPGASHSRYLHSLGVMHLAGRAFDNAFKRHVFSGEAARAAYRQCVRLAALLHDVGHAPFSHCTEFAMPALGALPLAAAGVYRPEVFARRAAQRASHEDYTVAAVTCSRLSAVISAGFPFTPRHVAALISREVAVGDDFFVDGGRDHRAVLSQIISSELDVDRLDYLVRDSYFSGARYGEIDVNWLLSNLRVHVSDSDVSLALDRRAIYAFDDFMVARYHMFVMVYFHHKSVVYEEMLKRWVTGPGGAEFELPAEIEAYLDIDDVRMWMTLRDSVDPWARGLALRDPWRRVVELHGRPEQVDVQPPIRQLAEAGIDTLSASSVGKLSRYSAFGQKRGGAPPIYVIDETRPPGEQVTGIEEATGIFERYQDERCIARVYVAPAERERARTVLGLGEWPEG
ncbi:MAG: HD domain-containing protein [Alphaproteobacteria bacterium]|nr:HD domain-containing protein [Alphaproteobacteria bacterium]MCB9797616.1 HD domain-containing protein [Alphaproteobacteria bacterium]